MESGGRSPRMMTSNAIWRRAPRACVGAQGSLGAVVPKGSAGLQSDAPRRLRGVRTRVCAASSGDCSPLTTKVKKGQSMYKDEFKRLLNNEHHYKRLSRDPTPDIQEEIDFLVNKGIENDWITKQEAAFLVQPNPKTPYFYILPKIHKGKIPPPGTYNCTVMFT
ncbi:hypothetical protein NDU88_003619 [Pleurodeles waltl]|uniref:Uncharacterized protein n=1 Tax=Pleurodeles waltl TaxID=8319 RepID=A0AAV7T6M9_PLEWA|nr:hypothetical protein NDU88_003619 [Pleurodeles waltl]